MSKTKFKTLMISFSLAVAAVCLSFAFVACGSDDDGSKSVYGVGEEGVYYYDKDSSTEYLMSLQSGTYMISADGSSGYSGTYSYDGEGGISFESSDGEPFTAAFSDDAMQLAISGTPYTFLKKVDYIVKFVDSGKTVDSQSVTYGKSASETDGEKDGYIFLGWYVDSIFTTKYGFNTAVTGDLTLYAYYIEIDSTVANFDVNFVMEGETIYSTKTQNGVVYDIPEIFGILGWWVSDTNDRSELTYRYDGQILDEATNLYAVKDTALGASVYSDKVTWEGSASSVTITVDGTVVTSSAANGAYAYDFDSLSTGRHEIEVSASGYGTENLVYVVNGLARVSNFSVYGTVLVYNAVENAQYYYISVTCANPSHDHTMVYNGNTLTYDFSNCEMGPDGISFTVYAYGIGYTESVSETFVYALILDGTSVTIDKTTDTASWTAVSGASEYEVYINGKYAVTTTDTGYSLKYYDMGDEIAVSVKPVAPGYYSDESEAVSYQKTTLRAPEITGINEYTVSWTEIVGATNYIIYVNYKQIETVSGNITSYALTTDEDFVRADLYVITVKAVNSADTSTNSQECDAVYASDDTLKDLLRYEDGVVYWQYAMAAGTYYVTVNDESEETVEGKNFFDVTFTRSGNNVITVWFTTEAGDRSEAKLTVTTYAVIFNSQGGELIDTIYVAKGDTLRLATPEYVSGTGVFLGWYTLPNPSGLILETYGGDGTEVVSGTMFTGNNTLILYACWKVTRQNIILDGGTYADREWASQMEYDMPVGIVQGVELPVPESADVAYVFYGWYGKEDGRGTRYTDEKGRLLVEYDNTDVATLYAYWIQVLKFDSATSTRDGSKVMAVSGGGDVYRVTEITIPETYDGLRVANIGSSAFNNCTTLETIYIPDTVEYIATSNNGYSSGSGAFAGCTKLLHVFVYATGEPDTAKEITYYSDEKGVLYQYSSATGYMELLYYPYGRTGAYSIPEVICNETETGYVDGSTDPVQVYYSVTSVATQVFYNNTKLTAVTIPATIKNIATQAFYGCTSLVSVTFLDTVTEADAEPSSDLTIGNNAFQICRALTSVTLPARLTESGFAVNTFTGCSALKNIFVAAGNASLSSVDGILCAGNSTRIILCPVGKSGKVEISGSIVTIDASAFASCTLITEVVIPGSVTEIGESAFSGCTGIERVTFMGGDESNDLSIRTKAFYGLTNSKFTEVELPSNLVTLEVYAFGNCTSLKTVRVTSRDLTMYTNSFDFADCAFGTTATTAKYYVTELYLDKNVPELDINAVFGSKIEHVYIEEGNIYYSSDERGVVYDAMRSKIIYYPLGLTGDYTDIPETVTKIGAQVFKDRVSLTGIVIPATVVEIEEEAFYGCTGLTYVTFEERGEAVLTIGEYAFRGCTALTSVSLPEGTETVGDNAFYNCTALAAVYIPSSVKYMGGYDATGNLTSMLVFDGCAALEAINVLEGNETFMSVDGILYLKGSDGKPSELILCPQSTSVTDLVLSSTITRVWDRAFYQNTTIESLSFDGAITEEVGKDFFGSEVFYECENLSSVTLPDGLSKISDELFRGCASLVTIVIPYTVTSVGAAAFYYCTNLEAVTFEDTPAGESEETLRFEDCTYVSNGTLTHPGYYYYGTFTACESLASVVLPDRTVYIGSYVFSGYYADYRTTAYSLSLEMKMKPSITSRSALESVTIGSGVTEIGRGAFRYADNLASVTFADGSSLTKVGDYAFAFTYAIKSVEFPDSLTTLGTGVFEYSAIESVKLSESLTEIPGGCFAFCESLKEVAVPAGVVSISGVTSLSTYADHPYVPDIGGDTIVAVPVTPTDDGEDDDSAGSEAVGAFYKCSALAAVTFAGGSNLETIDACAFYGCSSLKSVNIPATVETIGSSAFADCTQLSSVTFETDVGKSALSYIGDLAFARTVITSFAFPETTATEIRLGEKIFKSCKYLATIKLSAGITDLGSSLDGCYSVTAVEFYYDEATGEQTNTSYATDGDQPILYSFDRGSIVLVYGEIKGELTIPYFVTRIEDNAFQRQVSITEVYIPASVEYIGSNAFASCTSLTGVYFYKTYTDVDGYDQAVTAAESVVIGAYAFAYCASLTEINLSSKDCLALDGVTCLYGANVEELGSSAFSNCTSLTRVVLPATADVSSGNDGYIGLYVFANCTALETVEFSASTTYLSSYMFNGCTSLTSVILPATVTGMGEYVFRDSGLTFADLSAYSGTKIGDYVFAECGTLTEVKLGSSVTEIGNYAFWNCASLSSVYSAYGAEKGVFDISTLSTLGEGTFQGCESVGEVNLGTAITTMNAYVFYGCTGLDTIDLSKVTTMKSTGSFEGCTSLKEADLSSLSGTLGSYTFSGCDALERVTFGYSVTTVGSYAFSGSGLKYATDIADADKDIFQLPSNITEIDARAFASTKVESIVVPAITYSPTAKQNKMGNYIFTECEELVHADFSGVTYVGPYMFSFCYSLEEAVLPQTVTSIPNYAFYGCTSLEYVEMPGVTSVGDYAFAYCYSLDEINNSMIKTYAVIGGIIGGTGTGSASLGTYAFTCCTSLVSVDMSGSTDKCVNTSCFAGCTALRSVTLPSTVTSIYSNAFNGCEALTSINLPAGLTEIQSGAFQGCASLTDIALPDTLTTVGDGAFTGCSSLRSVAIPASVTSIGNYVFSGCDTLVEITVDEGNSSYRVVEGILCDADGGIICYPSAMMADGEAVIPDGLYITTYSFRGNTGIKSVTIAGMEEVPDYAFYGCVNLETVVLEEGVTAIGAYAFADCESLDELTLPSTLSSVANYAFDGSGVKALVLPDAMTTIDAYAFAYAENLEEVTFGANLTEIGNYAFRYCSSLKKAILPEGLETIGNYAFANCTSLKYAYIPESVTSTGTYVFYNDTALEDAIVNTVFMGNYMFYGDESLVSVTLSEGLDEIGTYYFRGCSSLVEIVIPSTVVSIGNYAFSGCTSLKKVTGSVAVEKIGSYAFMNTQSLRELPSLENLRTIGTGAFAGSGLSEIVLTDKVESIGASAFEGWTQDQTVYVELSYYVAFQSWSTRSANDPEIYYALRCFDGSQAEFVYDYVVE